MAIETAPRQHREILALCTYAPTRLVNAREALDAILATAIFDQSVSLLFCGDGVWQLVAQQGDYTGSDKSLIDSLAALPLYDIEAVYADETSLAERGLHAADLLPQARIIGDTQARQLLADACAIMSF